MKAYIASRDWADEGDVFFFSVEDEERLQAMKELINIYSELDLIHSQEMYWGTNEWFDFGPEDFIDFIDKAKDISEEELAVFKKFGVTGFNIYERMSETLRSPFDWNWKAESYDIPEYLTQEDLDKIKPVYLKLFELEDWNGIQRSFDEDRLYEALKPYCVELGWVKFDRATESSGKITERSEVIDWKVLDYEKESAVRFLENTFPSADRSLIIKVVNDNLKRTVV